jgi:hypothetical protein
MDPPALRNGGLSASVWSSILPLLLWRSPVLLAVSVLGAMR